VSAAPAERRAATLATSVGSVALSNPVLTASGTSGHGTELSEYGALADLGAVVVKSLSVEPWPGNPAPRVHGWVPACSTASASRVPGWRRG
jgi:dihydroorotate dehydrogenase (NAD+) catalytic subunit